jgi:protein O-mannosyl-transferase
VSVVPLLVQNGPAAHRRDSLLTHSVSRVNLIKTTANASSLGFRIRWALALGILLLVTWSVYLPSLTGPFVLDDAPNLRPLAVDSLAWEELRYALFTGNLNGLARSVSWLSLAITQFVAGTDPRPFRVENVLIHLINGLLLCWLAALLFAATDRPRAQANRRPTAPLAEITRQHWWAALLVAALWLLHPLQVSTVAYIVQRLVLLSAMFSLATAVCYLKGRLLMAAKPRAALFWMLIGFLIFLPLGLLSKENSVLIVPALLCVDWFVFKFQAPSGPARRTLISIVTLFLLLPIIAGLLIFASDAQQLFASYDGRDFDLSERLLTQLHALWLYLGLILFPIPGHMGLFHDGFAVQRSLDWPTMLMSASLLGLILAGIGLRWRAPLVGLGILWFFVWHGMESTVLPLELVFEHRNYLALFGPMLMLGVGLQFVSARLPTPRPSVVAAVALCTLLALNTASRAAVWGNIDRFAANEYVQHPESPRAAFMLLQRALDRSDFSAAQTLVAELQRRAPRYVWPLLVELLMRCNQEHAPTELLDRIFEQMRHGISRPGDIEQLREIKAQVDMGKCPVVEPETLRKLAAAMAENPRTHHYVTRIAALNLYAKLSAEGGDFQIARTATQDAIRLAATEGSPGWLKATMIAAADVASELPTYDQAVDFIKEVTRGHEQALHANRIAVQLRLNPPRSLPEPLESALSKSNERR